MWDQELDLLGASRAILLWWRGAHCIPMAGATVGDESQYVDFGNKNVRRVASSRTALVWSSQVLQKGHQGVEYDIDRCDADFEQSGTGDEDYLVLRKVLAGGASSVWELQTETNRVSVWRSLIRASRRCLGWARCWAWACVSYRMVWSDMLGRLTLVVSLSTRQPTRLPSAFIVLKDVRVCLPPSHV